MLTVCGGRSTGEEDRSAGTLVLLGLLGSVHAGGEFAEHVLRSLFPRASGREPERRSIRCLCLETGVGREGALSRSVERKSPGEQALPVCLVPLVLDAFFDMA